jgi:hypothetical protein
MKRLVAVILFGLGCAAGAALSEAGGLPEPERMIHRIDRFRPTHSLRVAPSAAPKNVHRIGHFHPTHSLRPGTR